MVSIKRITIAVLYIFASLVFSCNSDRKQGIFLVIDENATNLELEVVNDLKGDLKKRFNDEVTVVNNVDSIGIGSIVFLLGTPETSAYLKDLFSGKENDFAGGLLGDDIGVWSRTKLDTGVEAIVIAGSDGHGLQNAVYAYSKRILGIDPLEYWTEAQLIETKDIDLTGYEDQIIPPAKIALLSYFENDVDELANYRGTLLEYDWESYTELINSLARLGYTNIQLFDMLGRPEFFLRPEYKQLSPEYAIRPTYVDSLIDYAHKKGMKVQIDLSLGYKFKPLEQAKADCWRDNKKDWIQTWTYYLEKTPLGKADVFSLRPRNQVWDWEYKSTCDENKVDVFNEVYEELGKLINEHNPKAQKVMICYADGMSMFNDNLLPPKDWIVAWSDNGFGGSKYLPESTKGLDFGTYMHAGFWLNHTVHDPYPIKIDTIMKKMVKDYGADKYCLVNGQQFRPFLINIEAFAEIAQNPLSFDGNSFYKTWTERYFGKQKGELAVLAMKKLHLAQFGKAGYVEHLWEIKKAIAYLKDTPIQRPGRTSVPINYEAIAEDFEHIEKRLSIIKDALSVATEGDALASSNDTFYADYVVLPINLYADLISFENTLHQIAQQKRRFEENGDANDLTSALSLLEQADSDLAQIYKRRLEGDKNKKWTGWYNPKIRRPNNGFPTIEILNEVKSNLTKLKNY